MLCLYFRGLEILYTPDMTLITPDLLLNVHKNRHELRNARKALPGAAVDPMLSLWYKSETA